jgi:hypothetical protein
VDGTCDRCISGQGEVCVNRKAICISVDGGVADYVAVPACNLCRLPDAVSFEVGAVITDAVATPFHALLDVARLSAGESVAIIGVGGLGLHAVQIAKLVGASRSSPSMCVPRSANEPPGWARTRSSAAASNPLWMPLSRPPAAMQSTSRPNSSVTRTRSHRLLRAR